MSAAAKKAPPKRKAIETPLEDIEQIRSGMRPVLLEKFRVCVLEHRKRAKVSDDWKPDQRETKLIAEFEDALYAKAISEWKCSGVRGDSLKHIYVKLVTATALKALSFPCGPFPDSPLAVRLLLGEITAVDAADDKFLDAPKKDTPRQVCRRLLISSLLKHDAFAADRDRALKIANEIETSCFGAVIQQCKVTECPFRRCWESEQFVALYSARCGVVNSHIDPDSSVGATYGTGIVDSLVSGITEPKALGTMTAAELCPKATETEKAEIALRNQQKVEEKTSDLFQCPVSSCRARKCTYREVQTRSLDEPATLFAKCCECGHRFVVK